MYVEYILDPVDGIGVVLEVLHMVLNYVGCWWRSGPFSYFNDIGGRGLSV